MAVRLRDAYKDMVWKTWDGREVTMRNITQEHLSNAYWFMLVVRGQYDQDFVDAVNDIMRQRFDGQILPYVPAEDFTAEHDWLRESGNVDEDGIIWHRGKQIGYLPFARRRYYILLN